MKYIKKFEDVDTDSDDSDAIYGDEIIYAIESEDYDKVEKILNSGVLDLSEKYEGDLNLLLFLSSQNNPSVKIIKKLVDLGIDVNSVDDTQTTALMYLSMTNVVLNAIFILIEAGADWNILDHRGKSFLDILEKSDPLDKNIIINKYPDKYEDYMIKKYAKEKYNL